MTYPTSIKETAIIMRNNGCSLNNICSTLLLSKSTVYYWIKDIAITIKYKRNYQVATEAMQTKYRKLRESYQKEGVSLAKKADPLHMKVCMLYWGEGYKNRNTAGITNTDPYILLMFVKFLKKYYNVPDNKIRISFNYVTTNGVTYEDILYYWKNILKLTNPKIGKSTVDRKESFNNTRTKKHIYGICAVAVSNTRIVQGIFGAIQEYGKFTNLSWIE